MTEQPYIRSIHDNVSLYTRNCNEILTQEYLYEGGSPSDADPADYFVGKSAVKAAMRSGVRLA